MSKKIIVFFSVALAFVSCQKEQLVPSEQEGTVISLNVNDGEWTEEDPKTVIGADGKVYLDGSEHMAVFYKDQYDAYNPVVDATPVSGRKGAYTFTAPAGSESSTWYAIVPNSSKFISRASSNKSHSLFLSPVQSPSATSFDARFDYMTSKPFTIGADNTAVIEGFKRYFAVLRVDVKNLAETDKIYAATLTVENTAAAGNKSSALAGLTYVKMSENISEVAVNSILADASGKSVSAIYDEGLERSSKGVWPLWFVVNPVTLQQGGITLTLTTQDKTYTKTGQIPSDRTISVSKVASMGFNMNGATSCDSNPWTDRGSSLTIPTISGKNVTGLRVYAAAENKCRNNTKETITLKGVEYDFNFCKGQNATSLAANGGVCEIISSDGSSLSGETLTLSSGAVVSKIILLTDDVIDPSAKHPRLFVTPAELSSLKAKVQTAQGQALMSKLNDLSVPMTPEEEDQYDKSAYRYYYQMRGDISAVQVKALNYLLYKNASDARSAITTMLALLQETDFGTKNDMSRASGVRIMVGAMIYDWCHDQMTAEERTEYISEFKRIAATMECGWPLKGTDYICGHASEWMVLRDLLAAGIATYYEDSSIYDAVMQLINEKYIPVRNYAYAGGAYHQGADYVSARFGNDLTAMWMLSKLGMGNVFSEQIKDVPYSLLYRIRPDGQPLPYGDTSPNRRANIHAYALIGMLSGSYFNDPYLEWMYELDPSKIENHYVMLELLWRDFNLSARKPDSSLPLLRYCGTPYGWYLVRTGWDDNAVVAEMKVGERFFGNHQHADAGSFQIYYKEPLAIDSGAYVDGYSSAHAMNYFKRTIAHNSLLIYNSGETFSSSNYGGAGVNTVANDGGQRLPSGWKTCASYADLLTSEYTTGSVVSHWDDGSNAYLKGDITAAYSSSKVSMVHRSFFFLNNNDSNCPATMVIYDKVISKVRAYKKYFLLHCIEEPTIGTMSFDISRTFDGHTGKLHCTVLYPSNAVISKVGGAGHEFEVFGTNYPTTVSSDNAGEIGAWRVELCPVAEATENKFLNVLEMASSSATSFKGASKASSTYFIGCRHRSSIILFAKDGLLNANDDEITVTADSKLYLCDLAPGSWSLSNNDGYNQSFSVMSGENILVAELAAGTYTLKYEK